MLASTMPLIIKFFIKKKPIWKILRTDKNTNFEFTIKFLMTLDRSYIGYLGRLGTELLKSVLMYCNGTMSLIKLLFKMGPFTVWVGGQELTTFVPKPESGSESHTSNKEGCLQSFSLTVFHRGT
jgi:hypothetical protein